jgi:hypothetical protein
MDRVDTQTLDAVHESFTSIWEERSRPVAGELSQRKVRKSTKRQRRGTGQSSIRGRIQRRAAEPPSLSPLSPPNFSDNANSRVASGAPLNVPGPGSTFSQDQTPINLSGGDFAVPYFPPVHQPSSSNAVPTMNPADFDPRGGSFTTHSAPLHPFPMSISTSMFSPRQTGNSGGIMVYPGNTHEMAPFPSWPTARPPPYPYPFSEEVPQAGTSHFIPDSLPAPTLQATSTHLMHPQPYHHSFGWPTATTGPCRSRTYPSY